MTGIAALEVRLDYFSFMRKKWPGLFTACLLLIACGNRTVKENPVDAATTETVVLTKEIFQTGTVIPAITCRSNPALSFALYLPSEYDTARKFPAIIFFDPHASGEFVLKKYQHLADEFHFILVGSNDSKNGLTLAETNTIAGSLISEVQNRFAALDHISLAGFSGGAKVALSSASISHSVRDVIYCGAATPVTALPSTTSFLGFAGVDDVNYSDLVAFDRSWNATNRNHFLIEWTGKHEWPDSAVFRDAFRWIEFDMMRDRTIPVSVAAIDEWKTSVEKKFAKTSDPLQQAMLQQQMVSFLNGLADVSANRNHYRQMVASSAFQNAQQQKENILQSETVKKQEYITALQSKDLNWWAHEIDLLKSKHDPSSQRLLGFISLACYSVSTASVRQNHFALAEQTLAVYKLADPENADQPFISACLYARQGKNGEAIESLREAVQLGLNDVSKIQREPDLQSLQADPRMQALLEKMKQ